MRLSAGGHRFRQVNKNPLIFQGVFVFSCSNALLLHLVRHLAKMTVYGMP
jgi:hypothetical protein